MTVTTKITKITKITKKMQLGFPLSTLLVLCVASANGAQLAGGASVEVDPIRCWWKTSQGAVAIGQPFSIALTCAVLETAVVRVVPDESSLAVATVQLAPFELIGGSHPADLKSGQRRFFQYDYSLRIIDSNVIGKDVTLAPMVIHYRVESRVQSESLEGRDRTYLLPPLSVRVVSMVPEGASDIRDGGSAPFAAIEGFRFRARVLNIIAAALAALGAIVLLPGVVRLVLGAARRGKREPRTASDRGVLAGVASELADVTRESGGGWNPELLSRALVAVRIAAAYAVGRRVSIRPIAADDAAEARIVIPSGIVQRHRVAVSASMTAEDVAREVERLPTATSDERRELLENLQKALASLTRALYAQQPTDLSDAGEAVHAASTAVQRLRKALFWPALSRHRRVEGPPTRTARTRPEPSRGARL